MRGEAERAREGGRKRGGNLTSGLLSQEFDEGVVARQRRHVAGKDASVGKELRLALSEMVVSHPYRTLKLLVVLLHLGGQALERQYIPPYQRQILQIIYAVTTAFFVWDFGVQILGLGFFHHVSSIYNLLDLVALIASLVDHIWALAAEGVFSDEPGGQLATGTNHAHCTSPPLACLCSAGFLSSPSRYGRAHVS